MNIQILNGPRSLLFFISIMLMMALYSVRSDAQTIEVTATSPTTFTITLGNVYAGRIEEKIGTTWQTLTPISSGSPTYSYTRAAGSYAFRLYNCYPPNNVCSTSMPAYVTLTGNTAPAAPTISSSVTEKSITVSLTTKPGTTYIKLRRGTTALVTPPLPILHKDSDVTPGTTYTYYLEGCNANGCSPPVTSVITYPPVPANPTINASVSGASVMVSWTSPVGMKTFELYKGLERLNPTATPHPDSAVSAGSSYTYTIKACNEARVCSSGASVTITVPAIPAPPTVYATFLGASVAVNWNTPLNTTSFIMKRNGAQVTPTEVTPSGGSYKDDAVSSGTTYTYAVSACNLNGQCSTAATASITVPALPLFQVDVTGINTFNITIGNVSGWVIEELVGNNWTSFKNGSGLTRQTYSYTRARGTYKFRLNNCNPTTNGCSISPEQIATLPGNPPAAPALTVAMSGTSVVVKWTTVSGISYQLLRGSASLSATAGLYTDTDVNEGENHTYKVTACNVMTECTPASASITVPVAVGSQVYEYDALGRLKAVMDPVNGNSNYKYDKAGNRTLVE